MAYSLVKDDPGLVQTAALWAELHAWLHGAYPEAVLLPESDSSEPTDVGTRSGFAADFFLVFHQAHSALFNNGGAGTLEWLPDHQGYFFDAAGADGPGTLGTFLRLWDQHRAVAGADRRIVLASADHDFSRLATGPRTSEQLGVAFAFLLTWGSIPSIY